MLGLEIYNVGNQMLPPDKCGGVNMQPLFREVIMDAQQVTYTEGWDIKGLWPSRMLRERYPLPLPDMMLLRSLWA
jgi:hypothetical protein